MKNQDQDDLAGMTVNERLFVRGLIEDFDTAVRSGNERRLREILQTVKVDAASIEKIVNQLKV